MKPPFPACPSCGVQLGTAAIHKPKDDGSDVVVYMHNGSACDAVWGRLASDATGRLELLGSLDDYDDRTVARMIEESVIVLNVRVPG